MVFHHYTRLAAAGAITAILGATLLVSPATAYSRPTVSPATAAQPPPTTPGPEPPALGYRPPYAPATAPRATDLKPLPSGRSLENGTSLSPGASPAPGASLYPCPGYAGVDTFTPVSAVMADTYAWSSFAPVMVGDGQGDVNWKLNPYENASWYMFLHSLRWVGQAITAGAAGNQAALEHARAIAKDWILDNPYPWIGDIGADEPTMHRTNVLICLREAIMATDPGGLLPAADAWLDTALLTHAQYLQDYWSGPLFNHGTAESIALLGVGCLLDRTDLRDLAISRLSQAITNAIDIQGASNEQSTGYAWYNYALWFRAERALTTCNISPGTTIAERRQLLANFIAQSTNPLGKLAQIGDTEIISPQPIAGTDAEWAASQGTRGTPPTLRLSQYQAGYVFGRSGWGTGSTPFRQESFYSLHFGPGRALHGHEDHTSITYVARGRDILIDGGLPGFTMDKWRTWALSDYAHSVMTVPTATPLPRAATKLSRYAYQTGAEFYEMTDKPYVGVSRVRAVLFMRNPDVIVVLDRGASTKVQQWQTLWHLPADQNAKVYSRTTASAMKSGDNTRTLLFQVPFRQALPRGAILVLKGQTTPRIQGWHYPVSLNRRAAPTVMFARSGTYASILSVIAPNRPAAGVSYQLTTAANGWTNLNLNVGGTRVIVRISPTNSLERG